MDFQEWPLRRILLLSAGWIFAVLALLVGLLAMAPSMAEAELSGGVGAFSIGLYECVTLLLGPPLVLWFLWLVLRR